jgi:hypothetical protein
MLSRKNEIYFGFLFSGGQGVKRMMNFQEIEKYGRRAGGTKKA